MIQVSLDVYPYNRYPPYISAGAVLLSWQSLREMYLAIQHVQLFLYDDIYAGILAHLLGIPAVHNKEMRFWKSEIRDEDAKYLVCAHGFEAGKLRAKFGELVGKGYT